MTQSRREALKTGGGWAVLALAMSAGVVRPAQAQATGWNKAAFDTRSFADAVKALGGAPAVKSDAIEIVAPDIAENGAVVPIAVTSKLPGTQSIALLVDKNPNTLSALFEIPEGTEPFVRTNVKMAQTSNVLALVQSGGKYYYAAKEVKVTIGGCGG